MKPRHALLAGIAFCATILAPVTAQKTAAKDPPRRAVPDKPGLHERTLEVGETAREYLVHLPRGFKNNPQRPVPMVLMLHGRNGNGQRAASAYYGWPRLADREGFIAVFPTALGQPTSWQAAFRGRATEDTKFLSELITTLTIDYAIDPERVYMTGHSSGGFMSYSFAAMHPQAVAAIAPVAGLHVGRQGPEVPVSVISFHGMADDVVAYDNEHGKDAAYRGMPSALQSATVFARSLTQDDEAAAPERRELHDGKVHVDTWSDGPRGTRVELYSLEGWGHGWPTGRAKVDATPLIWSFFQEHGRERAADEDKQDKTSDKKDGKGAKKANAG